MPSQDSKLKASEGPPAGDTSTSTSSDDFVNHGLQKWEAAREKWLHHKNHEGPQRSAKDLDVDSIIDVIFSPRWRGQPDEEGPPRCFPEPVPLPQMVDILVDLWEAEGLDT